MTPTDLPTRPDVPLTVLAGSYADNMCALRHLIQGGALGVLADGTAITERIDADRWPTVVAALTGGATTDEVAAATGLDPDGVRIGLTMWAVDQRREGSISETRYEEILSLVDFVDDTVSEHGPQ